MPLLTFPLALILVSCFVLGSVVTWALAERRTRREREELEKQMTRALQTRYEMYEGLEQSVVKLLTRFEALEGEFKQRLIEARNPRAALEQTVRLRAKNPELWDLEREHHRVQAEQLGQISAQATRIAELMTEMETLEMTAAQHDAELAHVKARYETAVLNFNEADKAAEAKIERLESVVRELESFPSLYEATSRELSSSRAFAATREAELMGEIEGLQTRVNVLALEGERVQQLEELCGRREGELAGQTRKIEGLASEISAANQRCEDLKLDRDAAVKLLGETQNKLEAARASHNGVTTELENCRSELAHALQTAETRSTQLDAAVLAGRGSEERLAKAQSALEQSRRSLETLEQELSTARAEHETRWNSAQAELATTGRALQTAKAAAEAARTRLDEVQSEAEATRGSLRSKLASIEGELANQQARAENLAAELAQATEQLAQERASAEEQVKLLETALQGSQAQLALSRAKLNHHSSHVEEAWTVLSELKPMLASLEQKLKDTDEPPPALPSSAKAPTAQAISQELTMFDDLTK